MSYRVEDKKNSHLADNQPVTLAKVLVREGDTYVFLRDITVCGHDATDEQIIDAHLELSYVEDE